MTDTATTEVRPSSRPTSTVDDVTAPPRARHWAALPVLLSGTFLIVLDFFIVNVALPSMASDLHASAAAVEWVVAGYGLSVAVLLLAAGRLGDQWGRRRLFSIGIGAFTLASAVCGEAPNATELIIARVAQGAAAALISASVLAIIGVTYAGAERARAISVYATTMGFAAAGGQLIGGGLLALDLAGLGWRTVFLINVPVGIAALVLTPRLVPESRAEDASPVDWFGLLLATAGLTAIVLPLLEGRQQGWPVWTWLCFGIAPPLLAHFARRQYVVAERGDAPLLDLRLFRTRSFTAGLITQSVLWAGQASYFLVLALYLQQGRGLSAMQSGLVFTFVAGSYLVTSAKAPVLAQRYGRNVVTAGALMLAAGHTGVLAATAIGGQESVFFLAPGMLLAGAGMGLCIPALTTTVLSDTDMTRAGAVSGALATVQQVGNALGVAIVGLVFFSTLSGGYAHAFELSLATLAGLLTLLAVVSRALPARG